MGLFDRLFGRGQQQPRLDPTAQRAPQPPRQSPQQGAPASADEQAVRRYQYLLQTADPSEIERVHAEAFAKLTPQQRQEALQRLAQAAPDERVQNDSPEALARAATRAEMRRPGTLTTAFGGGGGMGMGMGRGGMMPGLGATLLTSVAGTAVGIATMYGMMAGFDAMFGDDHDYRDGYQDGMQDAQEQNEGDDQGDGGDQGGGDGDQDQQAAAYDDGGAGYDDGGYDQGGAFDDGAGDIGDMGSDLGGFDGGGFGDFGGGDFGGDF